ncbi:hypothetical protein [Actinoplanes sp. NPDC020271]|uniref:hypothetical protein n=1 Tax=Actinoplanes sp. NPDC020271 TaxID=3363896 RepID=UPI00379A4719
MSTVWFVGVSTGQSLINRAFPLWMADLGRDVRLVGRDLPVGASADQYRTLVEELRADDNALGAVITTHKLALLRAARDLIDELDPLAAECGEVNVLRRKATTIAAYARDPLSTGRVADEIWPSGDQLICLGAGGTAIAVGRHLLSRPVPPSRLTFADPDPAAGRHLREVLAPWAARSGAALDVVTGPGPWDALVASGPPGTLVVNATGLGKDRPGSPVTPAVTFPPAAVVWELNYRGDLAFLRHAQTQKTLVPYDGWSLFCHGWAAALTPVLALPDEPTTATRFAELAAPLRP